MTQDSNVKARRVRGYVSLAACGLFLASCASTVDHNPRRKEHLPPAGVVTPSVNGARPVVQKVGRAGNKTATLGDSKDRSDEGRNWGSLANISTSVGGFGW